MNNSNEEKLLVNVLEHPELQRDVATGAILVNDNSARENYLKQKRKKLSDEQRIQNLENSLLSINDQIGNILKLLSEK